MRSAWWTHNLLKYPNYLIYTYGTLYLWDSSSTHHRVQPYQYCDSLLSTDSTQLYLNKNLMETGRCPRQCFCFQNWLKCCVYTFILKIYLFEIKMRNFRGALTNVSANTEVLDLDVSGLCLVVYGSHADDMRTFTNLRKSTVTQSNASVFADIPVRLPHKLFICIMEFIKFLYSSIQHVILLHFDNRSTDTEL